VVGTVGAVGACSAAGASGADGAVCIAISVNTYNNIHRVRNYQQVRHCA
jgi:hypothetical protein